MILECHRNRGWCSRLINGGLGSGCDRGWTTCWRIRTSGGPLIWSPTGSSPVGRGAGRCTANAQTAGVTGTRHTARAPRPVCSASGSSLYIRAEDMQFRCASTAGAGCTCRAVRGHLGLEAPGGSEQARADRHAPRQGGVPRPQPGCPTPPSLLPGAAAGLRHAVRRVPSLQLRVWCHPRFPRAGKGCGVHRPSCRGGCSCCGCPLPAPWRARCASRPACQDGGCRAGWFADPRASTSKCWSMDLRQRPRVAACLHPGPTPLQLGPLAVRWARQQRIDPRCTICSWASLHEGLDA